MPGGAALTSPCWAAARRGSGHWGVAPRLVVSAWRWLSWRCIYSWVPSTWRPGGFRYGTSTSRYGASADPHHTHLGCGDTGHGVGEGGEVEVCQVVHDVLAHAGQQGGVGLLQPGESAGVRTASWPQPSVSALTRSTSPWRVSRSTTRVRPLTEIRAALASSLIRMVRPGCSDRFISTEYSVRPRPWAWSSPASSGRPIRMPCPVRRYAACELIARRRAAVPATWSWPPTRQCPTRDEVYEVRAGGRQATYRINRRGIGVSSPAGC
jgi:hypothetical protein